VNGCEKPSWDIDRGRRYVRLVPPFVPRIAVLAVAIVYILSVKSADRKPTTLVVEPELLAKLQTLADGLHHEIVLCLDGRVENDVAHASSFFMPSPVHSSSTRSASDACPRGTLATWHNHPKGKASEGPLSLGRLSFQRSGSDPEERASGLCALSASDVGSASRLGYPFIVISVDASTWCWWSLDEVRAFEREGVTRGPPAPDRVASD
jgi:hypothetical protein